MRQEQHENLARFQNNAAEQQNIRQFEAAVNAPGRLFVASNTLPCHVVLPLVALNAMLAIKRITSSPRTHLENTMFSAVAILICLLRHTLVTASSVGDFPKQQDSQPYTGQEHDGGLGGSRKSFGYQAGNGPTQYGMNQAQAHQFAAQQQHGNFGRDIRGEQGARYQERHGPGLSYMNQPREMEPRQNHRYSSQMGRGDSNLS